jgi:acyl-CoA oxidase
LSPKYYHKTIWTNYTTMAENRQMTLMAEARAKSTFDVEAMAEVIHGGRAALEIKRGAYARTETAAGCTDTSILPLQYAYTGREDLYREGLQTGKAAWEDGVKHDHSLFDVLTPRYAMSNASPFGIHYNLFGRSIDFLGSLEQRKQWMPLVAHGRVNGAYVQTELGHGSNVAGIQTAATFDATDDTIVLHTPNLSAVKYWPGSLGYSATHAVVMARLLIPSSDLAKPPRDYGIQPFLVQLRDRDTGRMTPGLELGDIGPMPGYNQNDNGFVSFTHVKIPRTDMLMGVCSLDRNGRLTRLAPPEAVYGTMLSSRTFITHGAAFQLAQAVTIATRYSVVREQGSLPFEAAGKGPSEIPIMAYKSQQYRLLTLLANAFAMNFAAKITYELQENLDARLKNRDYSTVAHVHGLMAGAKAWFTTVAAEGAEDAKRCCGGHGYLSMSGLPEIVATVTACCTLEGDNVVMWQQTARYLMKVMDVIETVKPKKGYVRGHSFKTSISMLTPSQTASS